MKILIYGAGVIGGQLCHALCACGNDVSVVARGAWAETLRRSGLRIHHYIQRKDTVDHPRVLEGPGSEHYDVVFAVMQYRQMERIVPDLAAVDSPIVVLTGKTYPRPKWKRESTPKAPRPRPFCLALAPPPGRGKTAG